MKKDKDYRIGIIGAGAAGLTAAETLKEYGYQNITILEKNPSAGGKCESYEYEGKVYELGAGLIAESNKTIFKLIKKYIIELRTVKSYTNNQYDLETQEKIHEFFNLPATISFLWQLLMRYRRFCHQYEAITKPGYKNMDLALAVNFTDWAEENDISSVREAFERYFTGFGYGYCEDTPMAFIFKYADWETIKSLVRGNFYTFPNGIQTLWKEVANQHKVFYNHTVKQVTRKDTIIVSTATGDFEFDYIFISSPLDESLKFLDASVEEKFLFSRILYNDYQCYAYSLSDFPNQTGFIPKYFRSDQKNQPMFWYKPYPETDFYTFYVLGDWNSSQEYVKNNIKQLVEKFGGKIKKLHTCRRWKYFPRYSSEDMKQGLYNQVENLQGKNKTYFIGELPSFSTVELTARYAKKVVETNF